MKKKKAAPKQRGISKWCIFIKSLSKDCTFAPAATPRAIAAAQRKLEVEFPEELVSLLTESDGVKGEYSLGLVWPLAQIVADNLLFRTEPEFPELYMPFDCLLFFGDAGNGDQFAYSICGGAIQSDDIFVWTHEDDSRKWIAPRLETYFDWWLTGRIEL